MRIQVPVTEKTRKRRRRRRIVVFLTYAIVVFALAWYFDAQSTTTIVFVRHADTDPIGDDPPLNQQGLARAERLADLLEYVDVVGGPNAIYADETRRTQQTAAPLAKRLGLEVRIADPYDVVGFMQNVLWDHRREIVVIVTQSDAIAPLVEELHGHKEIQPIGPNEHDNIYVVTIPRWGKVKTYSWMHVIGLPPPSSSK